MELQDFVDATGVVLVPNWLTAKEEKDVIARCREAEPARATVTIYGKKSLRPRATACAQEHGREYRYGNATDKQIDWVEWIEILAKRIGSDEAWSGTRKPDTMLINVYETRDDWINWHRDHKPVIDHTEPTAAISLGAERTFAMKRATGPSYSTRLPRRSLLIMPPEIQHEWVHSIRKERKGRNADREIQTRWSITWRCMAQNDKPRRRREVRQTP